MTAVGRFFYEGLTLNSAGTFFTDCKSRGGHYAEVTVIRGSTVHSFLRKVFDFIKLSLFNYIVRHVEYLSCELLDYSGKLPDK